MAPQEGPDPSHRLQEAVNRLELIERWADDLAHEIKNPFHAMVINLELVKRRAGDAEGLTERADVVESELHRVHGLIDAVLRLVRPWPYTGSANADAVFDAIAPVVEARAARQAIVCSHEPGAGAVSMAPADLMLVLLNLLDNAMDALGKEGRLETRFDRHEDGVELRVTDHGSGVAGLDGDPLDAGVTSRDGRSGLGLAVCRRLVGRVGGELSMGTGPEGAGTTVVVTLPVA